MKDSPFNQPGRKPLGEFKKFCIAVDNYKVKRFRQVLREKGFETKLGKGVTKDTAMLYVKGVNIDEVEELRVILVRLQLEFKNRN